MIDEGLGLYDIQGERNYCQGLISKGGFNPHQMLMYCSL